MSGRADPAQRLRATPGGATGPEPAPQAVDCAHPSHGGRRAARVYRAAGRLGRPAFRRRTSRRAGQAGSGRASRTAATSVHPAQALAGAGAQPGDLGCVPEPGGRARSAGAERRCPLRSADPRRPADDAAHPARAHRTVRRARRRPHEGRGRARDLAPLDGLGEYAAGELHRGVHDVGAGAGRSARIYLSGRARVKGAGAAGSVGRGGS